MSFAAKGFLAGLLLAAIPAAAQPPESAQTPKELVVGSTDSQPATVTGALNLRGWRIQSDFSSTGDLARPVVNGIPTWQLGMRVSRHFFNRFDAARDRGQILTRTHPARYNRPRHHASNP